MNTTRHRGMRTLAFGLALAMAGSVLAVRAATLYGCGGTPIVTCTRSAFLGKFVGTNVVNPANGGPIVVPVGLVPFVTWSRIAAISGPGFACAQPTGATLMLTINCRPVTQPTSAPIVVGPISIPVATPTTPGRQPTPVGNGPGTAVGGPTNVTIPGGLLTPGVQYRCDIVGTYEVAFSGIAGSVTAVGDTTFYAVDPSPADPVQPRVYVRHFDGIGKGFSLHRRGDQVINHFIVANNDPAQTLFLDLDAQSNQISRLPQSTVITSTFAISNPAAGTDAFSLQFAEDQSPGNPVRVPGDPSAQNDTSISGARALAPGETILVSFWSRSYGMCADGSCCDHVFNVQGRFEPSGDLAIGCAGFTSIVDESAKTGTPLCEVQDCISTGPGFRTIYSPLTFDNDVNTSTHFAGNIVTNTLAFPGRGTQLLGQQFAQANQIVGFAPTSCDFFRTPAFPNSAHYLMALFVDQGDDPLHTMDVTIVNLPDEAESTFIPFFGRSGAGSDFRVFHDRRSAALRITEGSRTIFSGSFFDIFENPPNGLFIDSSTSRQILFQGKPSGPILDCFPKAIVYGGSDAAPAPFPFVFDINSPNRIGSGTANLLSELPGGPLSFNSTVAIGDQIVGTVITATLPLAPQPPYVNTLFVSVPGSQNRLLEIPVVGRQPFTVTTFLPGLEIDGGSFTVNFNDKPDKPKDKAAFEFSIPGPSNGSLDGKTVSFTFGPVTKKFELGADGKPKEKQPGANFKGSIDKKTGKLKGKFTMSAVDLEGAFREAGVANENVTGTADGKVLVKVIFCDKAYDAVAELEFKSKQGKKANGSVSGAQ